MKIAQPIQMVQKVIGWLLMAGGVGAAATAGASLVLHLTNFNARDIRQDHQTTVGPNSPATHNETHGPNSPIHSGDTITIKIDNSKTYNYKAGDTISFSIIEVNKAENTISMRLTSPQTTSKTPENPQPLGSKPTPNEPVSVLPSGGGPAGNQGFNGPLLGPNTMINPLTTVIQLPSHGFGLHFSPTFNQEIYTNTLSRLFPVPGSGEPIPQNPNAFSPHPPRTSQDSEETGFLAPNASPPPTPSTSQDSEETGFLENILSIFSQNEPEASPIGRSCH